MATPDLRTLLKLHRAQFQGIIELRGVRRLLPIYEQSRAELAARLDTMRRAGRGGTFGAHHLRVVLAQVNEVLMQFRAQLGQHLVTQGKLARVVSSKHVVDEVKGFAKHFSGVTPVIQAEQIGVFRQIQQHVLPSLLNQYKRSMEFYTAPVVKDIRNSLALSLATGASVDDAIDRVAATHGVFDGARWRAERIVRTELAYSYGVVKQQTLLAIRDQDVPDLQKRLVETSDSVEGDDSKKLDGQVQPVDQPFVYTPPPGKKGYPPFMHPPGRPNDRAVVIPWRPEWRASALGDQTGVDPKTPAEPPQADAVA